MAGAVKSGGGTAMKATKTSSDGRKKAGAKAFTRRSNNSHRPPHWLHDGFRILNQSMPYAALFRFPTIPSRSCSQAQRNRAEPSRSKAGRQNARMLTDDPLENRFSLRQRQRPEVAALMHEAIERIEHRLASTAQQLVEHRPSSPRPRPRSRRRKLHRTLATRAIPEARRSSCRNSRAGK
jgi:hypothetical protein